MNTDNWIKRSEREPSASEFPCRAGYYSRGTQDWIEYTSNSSADLGSYTHWRSIKCDPPPRGATQRERDFDAAIAIHEAYRCSPVERVIREAIYAERRGVAKIAAAALGKDWGIDSEMHRWIDVWKVLRARCDEQGAK